MPIMAQKKKTANAEELKNGKIESIEWSPGKICAREFVWLK